MSADGDSCQHYRNDSGDQVRLLIVDDHAWMRTALADFLTPEDDFTVVGQCGDGSEVVDAAHRFRPDVVLMDWSMPRMDGLTATRALLDAQSDARVVVLTSSGAEAKPAAMAAGAQGFVSKGADPRALLRCVRSVAVGCRCCLQETVSA